MIIGIDITPIIYGTGVGDYTYNLVQKLTSLYPNHLFKLFMVSPRGDISKIAKFANHSNVKIYRIRIPICILEFFWNTLGIFPIEFFIGKCDVFHSSDWLQPPLLSAKSITTVHDLTPFLFPSYHISKIIKNHRRKLQKSIHQNSTFICVSKTTQKDLLTIFPSIKITQTAVIYEAYPKSYKALVGTKKQKAYAYLKTKFNIATYALAQGTLEPRKNLKRTIKAFIKFRSAYPDENIDLAIVGKFGWGDKYISNHPLPKYIKFLGYVSDFELFYLHACAQFLIYPSLYEGFGLPVLKSQALKIPVITSSTSALGELFEKSALTVNPRHIRSIYSTIEKLYFDSKLNNTIAKLGYLHSKNFCWSKTARQTFSLYRKIYDNRN